MLVFRFLIIGMFWRYHDATLLSLHHLVMRFSALLQELPVLNYNVSREYHNGITLAKLSLTMSSHIEKAIVVNSVKSEQVLALED